VYCAPAVILPALTPAIQPDGQGRSQRIASLSIELFPAAAAPPPPLPLTISARSIHSPLVGSGFHSRTLPSSPEEASTVPVTFHFTRHTSAVAAALAVAAVAPAAASSAVLLAAPGVSV
jgi:hypothetical protein